MPIMSIIVPAYNAEKYISTALDSLINQTLQDIEIICINDGSKDGTLNILNEYARNDSRIIVIDKKNEGSAAARRDGIKAASAEYIGFLDSDDYYESTYCSTMVSAMIQGNFDLVECGYFEFYDNTEEKLTHLFCDSEIVLYEKKDFIKRIFNETIVDGKEAIVNWNKVYKRDMILEYVTDYGHSLLDDYLFNLQYYAGVKRYKYIPTPMLNYRISDNSLSKRYNKDFYKILKEVNTRKLTVIQSLQLEDIQYRRAATWFCDYVKRYLIFHQLVLNDYSLFKSIMSDEILREQASIAIKRDWFTLCISKKWNCVIPAVYVLLTWIYSLVKKIKRIIKR